MTLTRISFTNLSGRNRTYAIYCMLLHASRMRGHTSNWKKSLDIEKDLEKGYNPDQSFAFYVDQRGQLTTEVLLSGSSSLR